MNNEHVGKVKGIACGVVAALALLAFSGLQNCADRTDAVAATAAPFVASDNEHVGDVKGIKRNDLDSCYFVKFRNIPEGWIMIGIVFDEPGPVSVTRIQDWSSTSSVFDPAILDGSVYEAELRAEIAAWLATPLKSTTWGAIKQGWAAGD
jgi:hypothetical protein